MKKIDKLVFSSFIGPFIITFLVVVFILLMQHMLRYFDDIIGKGIEIEVIGQLLFYFAIFMTPIALPLAVLLSSLIAFGNLGEHFELTAIKSSGISLIRVLRSIFIFVLFITAVAFWSNNYFVPKAALEAYSLLYDIKQKKPALELREGEFFSGIPGISIQTDKKFEDKETLKGIKIYDHRNGSGNQEVTVADSGRMYTILNERYLKLELFNGYNYKDGTSSEANLVNNDRSHQKETFSRSKFTKTQIVFDLSSFDLDRTDKKWFAGNRIMRNVLELDKDIDSIDRKILIQRVNYYRHKPTFFSFYFHGDSTILPEDVYKMKLELDSITNIKSDSISRIYVSDMPAPMTDTLKPAKEDIRKPQVPIRRRKATIPPNIVKENTNKSDSVGIRALAKLDSIFEIPPTKIEFQSAANMARQVKAQITSNGSTIESYNDEKKTFTIQWHKIISNSIACIAMFLIGAPLGSIIKKGGLGIPFLVSIFFFIIFYLLNMQGEKWVNQDLVSPWQGIWTANITLFIIGAFFLRQARIDARLFDADVYLVFVDKIKKRFGTHDNQENRGKSS